MGHRWGLAWDSNEARQGGTPVGPNASGPGRIQGKCFGFWTIFLFIYLFYYFHLIYLFFIYFFLFLFSFLSVKCKKTFEKLIIFWRSDITRHIGNIDFWYNSKSCIGFGIFFYNVVGLLYQMFKNRDCLYGFSHQMLKIPYFLYGFLPLERGEPDQPHSRRYVGRVDSPTQAIAPTGVPPGVPPGARWYLATVPISGQLRLRKSYENIWFFNIRYKKLYKKYGMLNIRYKKNV